MAPSQAVIVTGASGGFGLAVATQFGAEFKESVAILLLGRKLSTLQQAAESVEATGATGGPIGRPATLCALFTMLTLSVCHRCHGSCRSDCGGGRRRPARQPREQARHGGADGIPKRLTGVNKCSGSHTRTSVVGWLPRRPARPAAAVHGSLPGEQRRDAGRPSAHDLRVRPRGGGNLYDHQCQLAHDRQVGLDEPTAARICRRAC